MGEVLSRLFIPLHSLPGLYDLPAACDSESAELDPTFGGILQLFLLFSVYAFILFKASTMITEGSELLLLFPSIAPIVGSTVLPILGAVPDGAIVLFSGLGSREKAVQQLAVGVGALAGSTIMLLTIPWFITVFVASDQHLLPSGVRFVGVIPEVQAMQSGARTLLLTSSSYIVIQAAAFYFKAMDSRTNEIIKDEAPYAFFGLIMCLSCFVWYLYSQMMLAESVMKVEKNDGLVGGSVEVISNIIDSKQATGIEKGIISLKQLFLEELKYLSNEMSVSNDSNSIAQPLIASSANQRLVENYQSLIDNSNTPGSPKEKIILSAHFNKVTRALFDTYDDNNSGEIDLLEFYSLLKALKVDFSMLVEEERDLEQENSYVKTKVKSNFAKAQLLFKKLDRSADGMITYEEFRDFMADSLIAETHTAIANGAGLPSMNTSEEQIESIAETKSQREIAFEAGSLMFFGTAIVLVFSDPMVEVMSTIGDILGVSPFYISFILAPLASNASEFIATYSYAMKKTSQAVTISLSTLQGAAIMNNTFCLSIFLALIYFRKLEWNFTGETLAILFVELTMVMVSLQQYQTQRTAMFVITLFPLSLALVAFINLLTSTEAQVSS